MTQLRTYLKCQDCKHKEKNHRKHWCAKCLGFTLLELLVVIAIIGILASIVYGYFNIAREKSKSSQVATQINQIEKALVLFTLSNDFRSWPITNQPSPAAEANYHISKLISNNPPSEFAGFADVFSGLPSEPFSGGWYVFSNRDIPYSCGGLSTIGSGVNIRIGEGAKTVPLATELDEIVDGGDGPYCGKVRYGNGNIYYLLANDTNDI